LLAASFIWLCDGGVELEENFELQLVIHEFRLAFIMGLALEPLLVFVFGDGVFCGVESLESPISGLPFCCFGV
jgi:hypothetical protein